MDRYGMFDSFGEAVNYCVKNDIKISKIQKSQNAMTSHKYRIFPLRWRMYD